MSELYHTARITARVSCSAGASGRRDLLRIALTASRFDESFGVKPQVSHTIALGPPVPAVHFAALANEVFETWASPSLSPSLHQSQIAPPRRTPFVWSGGLTAAVNFCGAFCALLPPPFPSHRRPFTFSPFHLFTPPPASAEKEGEFDAGGGARRGGREVGPGT